MVTNALSRTTTTPVDDSKEIPVMKRTTGAATFAARDVSITMRLSSAATLVASYVHVPVVELEIRNAALHTYIKRLRCCLLSFR